MDNAVQLPSLHEYAVDTYRVDGERRTIRFSLRAPESSSNRRGSSELVFSDVEGYLFERDLYFAHESQWGWPQFWRGSADLTAAWLASRGCRVWRIATSYGLSGWVVAGNATFHNGHAS